MTIDVQSYLKIYDSWILSMVKKESDVFYEPETATELSDLINGQDFWTKLEAMQTDLTSEESPLSAKVMFSYKPQTKGKQAFPGDQPGIAQSWLSSATINNPPRYQSVPAVFKTEITKEDEVVFASGWKLYGAPHSFIVEEIEDLIVPIGEETVSITINWTISDYILNSIDYLSLDALQLDVNAYLPLINNPKQDDVLAYKKFDFINLLKDVQHEAQLVREPLTTVLKPIPATVTAIDESSITIEFSTKELSNGVKVYKEFDFEDTNNSSGAIELRFGRGHWFTIVLFPAFGLVRT